MEEMAAEKEYICPMHPQIRQSSPGSCPICGMSLEPKITSQIKENPELKQMSKRFWIGVFLTIPIVLLAMLETQVLKYISYKSYALMQTILATPVVLWAGAPFFQRGWRFIVTGKLNMFTLISLGIGAAYFYSLAAA